MKYMLEWCMEYLKKQHTGFKFKKAHLMLCANDLNKKFAMGVTVDQVDRHYRYHKENWKCIATTLSNNGNTFDETRLSRIHPQYPQGRKKSDSY